MNEDVATDEDHEASGEYHVASEDHKSILDLGERC